MATAVIAVLLLVVDRPGKVELLAYVAILAVPAALAVGAFAGKPALFAPAAMLSIALSPMLFTGMPLLLIPGLLYVWAYVSSPRPKGLPTARGVAAVVAPIVLTIVALRVVVHGASERCVTTTVGNITQTDCATVPTVGRAVLGFGLACAAVVTGWVLARSSAHVRKNQGDEGERTPTRTG